MRYVHPDVWMPGSLSIVCLRQSVRSVHQHLGRTSHLLMRHADEQLVGARV
jgi:hypothetical protein